MYKQKISINTFVSLLFSAFILVMSPQAAYGQGGAAKATDVRVVNTSSEPVPTTVQGTTTVTGNVNVANTPTVGISSSANSVQAQQSGTWNVGINGTPTVNLASGASVGISGTPNVSLVSGTTVQISNTTANPVPVQNVGGTSSPTTLLFNSGTVSVPTAPGTTALGDFDARAFSKIRVAAGSNCADSSVNPEDLKVSVVIVEGGQPIQMIEELFPCLINPFRTTKMIDMPGATLRITVSHNLTHNVSQNVQVVVYGR